LTEAAARRLPSGELAPALREIVEECARGCKPNRLALQFFDARR
jgi:hypothetical protein